MTRLIDRLFQPASARAAQPYWEGVASGASTFSMTYDRPDRESILPLAAAAAKDVYGTNDVVAGAVLQRMLMFSEAAFKFRRSSDKKLFGDERLLVLERPWPGGTAGELLARMEQDVSWAGNAFIWDAGDQLVRWRPDWVTIESELVTGPRGHYRKVVGYHFDPPADKQPQYGAPQDAPASDVVHWAPLPDPEALFRGQSWMTPVIRQAQADSGMTAYKEKYLENAATPNILLRYSQKLSPGTIDGLRERITARYGGAGNAYKTLILDQGADLTVVGANLQQLDYSNVQDAGAARILANSGVPAVLLGLESLRGAGRGYQESVVKFANLWARPQWRSVCAALQKLTPGADVDAGAVRLWFDTTDIAALQDTETNQAQVALVRAQALLVLAQAGYTQESAVSMIQSGDVGLLEGGAQPVQLTKPGQVQHLLPQAPGSGPTPGMKPLPAGSTARLPVGSTSPGDGGNGTRPAGRPAATRRP